MMNTALIITSNPELESVSFLRAAAEQAGLETKVAESYQKADLVIHRKYGMDYSDLDIDVLQREGANTLNPVAFQRICRDKWIQHQWLLDNELNALETYRFPNHPNEEGVWVLKTIRGMQGRGVTKFDSLEELLTFISSLKDQNYIVQKGLNFSSEFRCVFIGDRRFWFEKTGGNLFKGGSAQKVTRPGQRMEDMADVIFNQLSPRFAAVDFLDFEGELYPIDLNCYPGVELIKDEMDSVVEMLKRAVK